MQNRIACYGAVVAIILEQLDAHPRSTITESPNPLVRLRDQVDDNNGWHPDELITRSTGKQYVLVWDRSPSESEPGHGILSN